MFAAQKMTTSAGQVSFDCRKYLGGSYCVHSITWIKNSKKVRFLRIVSVFLPCGTTLLWEFIFSESVQGHLNFPEVIFFVIAKDWIFFFFFLAGKIFAMFGKSRLARFIKIASFVHF